jgi:hypothetical protein
MATVWARAGSARKGKAERAKERAVRTEIVPRILLLAVFSVLSPTD